MNFLNFVLGFIGAFAASELSGAVVAREVNPNPIYSDFSHWYSTEVDAVFYPKTISDVQEIVKQAKEQGKKIALAGTKMSQGGHSLPSQTTSFLLNSKLLNRVEIIVAEKMAKVGPGSTWKDIQEAAHQVGLAVQVMQASNLFSVGGSLSTNVHGWDHKRGALAETVRSVTIVDAEGEIQTLRPGEELFSLVLGGYGMFGVIVEAEIALADDVVVQRLGTLMPVDAYPDYFVHTVQTNPDMVLHYGKLSLDPFHLFESVIAVDYTATDVPYQRSEKLPHEPANGHWYERLAIHALRTYPYLIPLKQIHDNQTFLQPKVMSRNEAMQPTIRFVYDSNDQNADMLQEFFLPIDQLTDFLMQLRAVVIDYDIHLFNATIRHVKQDCLTALPYAQQDVLAVVLYYNEPVSPENIKKVELFTQRAVDTALAYGGTYYLPYHRFPSREQFQKAYPQYKKVKDKRNLYDPQRMFSSQFTAHYFE